MALVLYSHSLSASMARLCLTAGLSRDSQVAQAPLRARWRPPVLFGFAEAARRRGAASTGGTSIRHRAVRQAPHRQRPLAAQAEKSDDAHMID